jgi:hypothetical protein
MLKEDVIIARKVNIGMNDIINAISESRKRL